jgi:quaternary ammonium compound-resistance protein SugE
MAWVALLVSAVLEAVWATALGASEGFSKPEPTLVFCVALALSMVGLGYSAKHIAMSTAYAIWTGTGAALTVTWAMLTGGETVTVMKVFFLIGIVGSVIGLKLVKSPVAASETTSSSNTPR